MNVTKNALGQNILVGNCSITGRLIVELFSCPPLQVLQIAKFSGEKSVRGVVLIAHTRYGLAQEIRRERRERRQFLEELSESDEVRFYFTRKERRWLRWDEQRRSRKHDAPGSIGPSGGA